MRLLKCENPGWFSLTACRFSLTEFAGDKIPTYAILSHTWGADGEEVTFEDLVKGTGKSKAGYEKLRFCGEQAARDGLLYFWVDTCCINKANNTELHEAINSMFRWYRGATKCYVYLSDVSMSESDKNRQLSQIAWESAFQESRWFTRGWTLQELIAPQSVEFFSREGKRLGNKKSLEQQIHKITGIVLEALQGRPLSEFSVDERMSWAAKRETTREEDATYSLLGIFDIHMPLIYGEGQKKALVRLQKEIQGSLNPPSFLPKEVRRFFSSQMTGNNPFKPFTLSFNDAPIDLLSTHFIGRERELALVQSAHDIIEENTPTRCAIWGIPGVGKSQLALRYTKLFLEDTTLSAVFWISASSVEKLYQGFSRLLNLVDHPDQLQPEQNARVVAARRWLEQPEVSGILRWLLVLDNVDITAFEFLRENLPRQGKQGRILITTRTEFVAHAVCRASGRMHLSFELETPTVEDAVTLFIDSAGVGKDPMSNFSRGQITELVKYLGRLPFAVDQAASFMVQSYQTIDSLMNLYRSNEKHQIIEWQNVFSTYEAKSISANFASHLRDLRHSSPAVLNLLNILVFFDPERIQIEMIKTGALVLLSPPQPTKDPSKNVASRHWRSLRIPTAIEVMRFGFRSSNRDLLTHCPDMKNKVLTLPSSELDSLIKLMSSEVQLQSALQQLQMLSFVKRRPVHEGGALCIHDLTQTLVQLSLISEGTQIRWFRCAVRIACGAFRLVEIPASPEFWHRCEGLISHILSLRKHQESVDDKNVELLIASRKIASYWCSRGRYDEARETYQQILAIGSDQLDTAGVDAVQITVDLAEVNWHAGKYSESILLYEEARRIRESQLGNDHPDTISVVESIAIIYRSQGRYAEAQSIFDRVLASRKISLGPDHPDTIRTIDNLARAARSQGRYSEAETLYKQVLTRREAQLGIDHPDTLWTADNLANNYRDQGRHSEALILLDRVFQGRKSQLGDDHPQTLWTLANIAKVFSCQGRFLEAEPLYGQVLVGNEKQLGYNHQETLWVVDSLANLYHQQERFEEATVLYHRALLGREERLGHEHPNTMRTINGLANLYRDRNDFIRSEALYKRLLRGRKANLRSGHPDTLQTYHDMARLFVRMERNHEAEQYYRQALSGSIEELGSLHPDTRKRKQSLISFLKDRESQDKAAMGEVQEGAAANEAGLRATQTISERQEPPVFDG